MQRAQAAYHQATGAPSGIGGESSGELDGWGESLDTTPPFRFAVFRGAIDQRDDGVADVLGQIRPRLLDVAQGIIAASRCQLATIFAAGALPERYRGSLPVS